MKNYFKFLLHLCLLMVIFCDTDIPIDDEQKLNGQLFNDVFVLKDGVEQLQADVDTLNRNTQTQINLLEKLKHQGSQAQSCDHISHLFNSTFSQYSTFEDRIVGKLNAIQDEQTSSLHKILERQKTSQKYHEDISNQNMTTKTLEDIQTKIDRIEKHITNLESIEEKLKQNQINLQSNSNEDHLNLLQAILEKLNQNQEKIDRFEKLIPSIEKLVEFVKEVTTRKKILLPTDVIYGLQQIDSNMMKRN
ncbi:uncharacterized protein LOC142235265 [Haematobia irritans]|uniref:uncharacterized protein LOC142235265 n=1 Tax=Haematobia irritans TaxID=7368 RepID=UPI003F4FA5A3